MHLRKGLLWITFLHQNIEVLLNYPHTLIENIKSEGNHLNKLNLKCGQKWHYNAVWIRYTKKQNNSGFGGKSIFTEMEKGAPVHTKASVIYNDLLKHFKI